MTLPRRRHATRNVVTPARPDTGTYYWIWGKTNTGKNYIDGPYTTEEEAWNKGYQVLDSEFKIIPLNTRNSRAATNVIKRMDLEETKSIETSLARARHGNVSNA